MKLFYLLLIIIGLNSCRKAEKDFDDYFPTMQITAVAQLDGSVVVTATIIENGTLPISLAGFAYGETADFSIDENQMMVDEITNNSFAVTYPPGFDISKTYYFKAWITNSLGYKESTSVSLSNIEAIPVDGPCSNPLGYLYIYVVSETVGIPSVWQENVDFNKYIDVLGSYSNVKFTFDNIPSTGIYQTTQAAPNPSQVQVTFSNTFSTFIQSSLNPGQSVYVNQTSPTTWTIEVCSATWTYNSFDYTFSTFFEI